VFYLCLPSNVGVFAWSHGFIAEAPATILFCVGVALLIGKRRYVRSVLYFGLLFTTLSHLIFEVFYFQEVTILALAAVLAWRRPQRQEILVLLAVLGLNTACLTFNRLVPAELHRSFSAYWWYIFVSGHLRVATLFADACREFLGVLEISLLAFCVLGLIGLLILIGFVRVVLIAGILGVGASSVGLLHAMAGYGLAVQGEMARTATGINFFASLGCGFLALGAWELRRRLFSAWAMALLSAASVILCLTVSSRTRTSEWANTWEYEKQRLAALPADYSFQVDDQRLFVLVDTRNNGFTRPALAPWEITGAIAYQLYIRSQYKDRRMMIEAWERPPGWRWRWFVSSPGWWNRWDGSTFSQGLCGNRALIVESSGASLWIWPSDVSAFALAEAGWHAGCGKP
jgi:hypothetical protein